MFDQTNPSRNTFKRLLEESFCLQKAKIKKELQDNSSKIQKFKRLLSTQARDYYAIPASSAPIERLFLKVGHLVVAKCYASDQAYFNRNAKLIIIGL